MILGAVSDCKAWDLGCGHASQTFPAATSNPAPGLSCSGALGSGSALSMVMSVLCGIHRENPQEGPPP